MPALIWLLPHLALCLSLPVLSAAPVCATLEEAAPVLLVNTFSLVNLLHSILGCWDKEAALSWTQDVHET